MRAVIQRVKAAKVMGEHEWYILQVSAINVLFILVLDELISCVGPGICVLVGIKTSDTITDVEYL